MPKALTSVLLLLLFVFGVASCGDATPAPTPTDTSPGLDTGVPDVETPEPDASDEDAAEAPDGAAEDIGADAAPASELPQAWVYPQSPVSSEEPVLVELQNLDGDGTLSGTYARVRQCTQDLDTGQAFTFAAGNFQSPATLCTPADVDLANAEGSFVDVPLPDEAPESLSDGYAAVATYYALQQAHAFFSETHGWDSLDNQRVEAVVNVQAHLAACEEWEGIPEGFYLPSGVLPKYGGLPISDGPVIAIGQASHIDLAHFLPVTVHEYAHVIMGGRVSKGFLEPFGASLDALALSEGLSDYFSSAITGATVHADFGLGPGEVVVFAPCDLALGGVYSYDTRRDLTEALTCPESLAGHMHGDGLIASSALWALRTQLGEPFDAVVVAAVRGLVGYVSFEGLSESLIEAAQLLLDPSDAATVEAVLSERGLIACERSAAATQIGARGFAMTLTPWLDSRDVLGPGQPGPLQLELEVAEDSTQLEVTLEIWTPFSSPSIDLILKKGAPVAFETQPVVGLVHDGELVVPVEMQPGGAKGVARLTTPCLEAGTWHAAIRTREPDLRILTVETAQVSGPLTAPTPPACALPTLFGPTAAGCMPADIETVQPGPGEGGHWAGARLVPPQAPFAVHAVAYQLSSVAGCNSALPHRVELSVLSGDTPEASPTVLAGFDAPADATMAGWRTRRVLLDEPIVLQEGESLLVSVEMSTSGSGSVCLAHCTTEDTPQSAFWSNATDTPYDWQELSEFGLKGNLMVTGLGYPVDPPK